MKVLILLVLVIIHLLPLQVRSSDAGWNGGEFMPSGIAFIPLTGNPHESRMAIRKLFHGADLHVDIGNTIDLMRWNYSTGNDGEITRSISLGASFFAYGYITSVAENRLKVDAIDGFFGIHLVYSTEFLNNPWKVRLRLMHQSAHMVDGGYDKSTESWVDGRLPISYTRDQAEISILHHIGRTRVGGGAGVVWLRRPDDVSPYHVFLAADRLFRSSTDGWIHFYGGYFLRGEDNGSFTFSHSLTTGVKFGQWNGKGIRLFLQYYNGLNIFGEYFNERLEYVSVGFCLDFR